MNRRRTTFTTAGLLAVVLAVGVVMTGLAASHGWLAGDQTAPSGDDQVLVSSSSTAADWKTVNDCNGANKAIQYTQSSNSWGCITVSATGDLVKLSSTNFSGASTVDLASWYSSTYETYVFKFRNVVPSTTTNINLRVSSDGGSTWDSTAGAYTWAMSYAYVSTGGGLGIGGVTAWNLRNSDTTVTANTGWNFSLEFSNPSSTTTMKSLAGWWTMHDSSIGPVRANWFGEWNNYSTAVNGLRVYPNAGTITGTVDVFAYVK